MKSLLLALALLAPAASQAALPTGGVLSCELQNNQFVKFHLVSGSHGLGHLGQPLTIVANGVLHSVFDTVVKQLHNVPGKISVNVSTLNAQGRVDEASGEALVEVDPAAQTARIHLTKFPPRVPENIIFQEHYELVNCQGSL